MARPPHDASRRNPVLFADAQGLTLPIIDITNPRFAVPEVAADVTALRQAYLRDERRQRFIPPFILRWMLQSAVKESRLFRALFASETGFIDAISTYVMKLGPDNLPPPYDTPMDRRFAASPHVTVLRLRMAQIAQLLADGLEDLLAGTPARPLVLLNIGGGPALDSLNALILLKRDRPGLLRRPISVIVLDMQSEGPSFGANALTALKAEGAPLSGLAVDFAHRDYDWNEPNTLVRLVQELVAAGRIIAVSSEGALFEYGSDDAIRANLRALHNAGRGARLVVGSVTTSDDARRRMIANSGLRIVPRGLVGFTPLAEDAGWVIAATEPGLLSDQILLKPA